MKIKYFINENDKKRIDVFLKEKFFQYSRKWLQKIIKQGKIKVNQKQVKPSYVLKTGDKIEGKIFSPSLLNLKPDYSVKLKIVFEDKDIAVIEKPANITVHPSLSERDKTLANAILARWPEVKKVGENELRPGIVHRLDKETSGLIVIAKNQESFLWLKNQFQQRKVEKKYLALAAGDFKKDKGEISLPLGRSKRKPTQRTAKFFNWQSKTKTALTHYGVIKKFGNFTLVEVIPKTGRQHQIRVHLAAIGHPVAGDKKYGINNAGLKELNRHFLHASYLKFEMPDGKIMEFKSELPQDLKRVLGELVP